MSVTIVSIESFDRQRLAPLFAECRFDRVLIDSVLEGDCGEAFTDSLARPTVARLDAGSFTMLAGDPGAAAARRLLEFTTPRYLTPQTAEWQSLLTRAYAGRTSVLEFTTYSAAALSRERLRELENAIPSGYRIVSLDATLAESCGRELDNCAHHAKPNTDSTRSRTPIPRQAEQSFHGKPNTDSTPSRTVCGLDVEPLSGP